MRRLVREGFAPAMFALATWIEDGRLSPEGTENFADLMTKAADQKFLAALYEVARRSLSGQGFPVDRERGLKLIREAASRGNRQAQLSLANLYETGDVVPKDPELALKYFRLCASGEPSCQYAVARLELAADKAYAPARTLLEQERPNVTAEQAKRVAGLKKSLSPPQ